jgi:hypothetical protein
VLISFLILYWRKDPFLQQITFAGKSFWSIKYGVQYVIENLFVARWIVPIGIGTLGFGRAVTLRTKAKLIFFLWAPSVDVVSVKGK